MGRRVVVFVLFASACVTLLVAVYSGNTGGQLEPMSWMAGIISAFLSVFAVVLAWPARKSASERVSTPAQLDEAERALRSAVSSYFVDELRRRGLDDVVIPQRWSVDGEDELVVDETGALAGSFDPAGRLLVVGEPGGGKTTACLIICRALVWAPGQAVPVLIPALSWRSAYVSLAQWATDWIASSVRVLSNTAEYGGTAVAGLVADGRIRCVIDGLDELPEADRLAVVKVLERTDARTPFVITSRPGQARRLRAHITRIRRLREHTLARSSPQDSVRYLATFDQRWNDTDTAPITRLLTSPLLVYLLRQVYLDRAEPLPGESLERQLWRVLVPSLYGDIAEQKRPQWQRVLREPGRTWRPELAERWLTYLARRLAENTGELRWWSFRNRMDRPESCLIFAAQVTAPLFYVIASLISRVPVAWFWVGVTSFSTLLGLGFLVKTRRRFYNRYPKTETLFGASFAIGLAAGTPAVVRYGWPIGLAVSVFTWSVQLYAVVPLTIWLNTRKKSYTGPLEAIRLARRLALINSVPAFVAAAAFLYAINDLALYTVSTVACMVAGSLLIDSVWGGYLSARISGALDGNLPWRLHRFLEDACKIGLLQRVGPHYAFRHAKLRAALTDDESTQATAHAHDGR